ncbi:hypothetical protein H6P81_015969 [Aristolochia fimbriata]|uniref:Uncharacterized protein n=1 Tax=Aristolochia fimbriata TaxID=158543 RepID=A0AAV7E7M7_ARIFI|nr:hypothetical protein H6P81_015969 [Aristolochia fimbriata]
MDGFAAADPYPPPGNSQASMSRRGGCRQKPRGRKPGRSGAAGADLGGSSKYSNENFEGKRGKVPCERTCTWAREVGKMDPRTREKDWLEGWARGPSPNPPGCRWTARSCSPRARAGRRRGRRGRTGNAPLGPPPAEQPTQNWYRTRGTDRLIKTKHCDGPRGCSRECDFCPLNVKVKKFNQAR